MPYKDPEMKLKRMKEWRERKIQEGYGKALYARRRQRLENEVTLRKGIERGLELLENGNPVGAQKELRDALDNAPPVTGTPIETLSTLGGPDDQD